MSTQTFTKEERLRKKSDIDRVFRKGRVTAGKLMRVHVLDNNLTWSRLAVSVPGKVGGAVKRNRWKRLVREAFRLNKDALGPGLDIVVVPACPPAGLKRQDVDDALVSLVRRLKR